MNILILTPVDATSILITGQNLFTKYGDSNDIFSAQMMALLTENNKKGDTYAVTNHYFAAEIRDNPNVMLSRNKHYKNLLVFGNCDKSTIHFDHIITWEQIWSEENHTDTELATLNEVFAQTFDKLNIPPINWYTYSDAEYCFPSWDHLTLFLKTLGVKADGV